MASDGDDRSETTKTDSPRSRWNPRAIVGGAVGGMIVGSLIWGLVLFFWYRDPVPLLTEQNLDEAQLRWKEHGPASYNADITISGIRAGKVHIEVRDKQVTAMNRDGVVPEQRRTWEYWTVESQFDTILEDLDSAKDPVKGFGAPPGSQAVLRAEFDPQLGYSKRYERFVLGASLDVGWEITRFEPVP